MFYNFIKRKLAVATVFLFIGMNLFACTLGADKGNMSTQIITQEDSMIYVDDDSECPGDGSSDWPYCKIQYAIDNASTRDTIFVYDGTYYEGVVINKDNLTLLGEDKKTTTIISDNDFCVKIMANNLNMSGFKISRLTVQVPTIGIFISSRCDNNMIIGNIITNVMLGIWIKSSFNIVETNLIYQNFKDGIALDGLTSDCNKNFIAYNEIILNNNNGILIENSNHNIISENNISSNNPHGVYLSVESSHNTIMKNTIFDNYKWGVFIGSTNSDDNIFYGNTFIDNGYKPLYPPGGNAYDESDNTWNLDYGDPNYEACCGNLWDNHECYDSRIGPEQDIPDAIGDGICDTPYMIPPTEDDKINVDRYPLVGNVIDFIKPTVKIISPQIGYIYVGGQNLIKKLNDFIKELFGRDPGWGPLPWLDYALIIGRFTFKVSAQDNESGMKKVEFYNKYELQYTDYDKDGDGIYIWPLKMRIDPNFELTVKGYDNANNYFVPPSLKIKMYSLGIIGDGE